MMDLYRSHRPGFGKILLETLLNFLVRHFERALSSVLEKQQPQRTVVLPGPRLELLPVLMVVLTQILTQVRWSHNCLAGPKQPSEVPPEAVTVVEGLPMEEQQLSSKNMYLLKTQND